MGGTVSVLLNNGDGTFADDVQYAAGNGPASIALGDIDRNGTLDVVVGSSGILGGFGDFSVLPNLGNGTFGSRQSFGPLLGTVALGDLNGNGMLDVVSTSGSHRIGVAHNTCPVPCDSSADCNGNGIADCDEINLDPDLDVDGNNVLDTCETTCVADLDASGSIGFGDLTQVLNAWGPCNSICECTTSQTTWQNEALGTFTGSFTMEFDHTPLLASTDAVVTLGKSPLSGPTFDDYAILVRLDPNGYYNVRNGNAYTFDTQVLYSAGVTNRIRIEADIASSTYSVWVTPDGGVEAQIASNYAFRTSQQGITEIDTLGVWGVDPDAFTVCDVVYGPTGALGSCPCLPDLDGNGTVGFSDLTMLIAQWGACP